MTAGMILMMMGIGLCVLAQGFFSGSEIAMVSANRLVLESARPKMQAPPGHEVLKGGVPPRHLFVGTNLCVVTGTTLVTSLLVLFGMRRAVSTLVLFYCLNFRRKSPQSMFQTHADRLAPVVAHLCGSSKLCSHPR